MQFQTKGEGCKNTQQRSNIKATPRIGVIGNKQKATPKFKDTTPGASQQTAVE